MITLNNFIWLCIDNPILGIILILSVLLILTPIICRIKYEKENLIGYNSSSDIVMYFSDNKLIIMVIGVLLLIVFAAMVFMHYYDMYKIAELNNAISNLTK